MSDDQMIEHLRNRIANTIRQAAATQTYWTPGPIVAGIYADAIIKELGLQPETNEPIQNLIDIPAKHRYITPWETD